MPNLRKKKNKTYLCVLPACTSMSALSLAKGPLVMKDMLHSVSGPNTNLQSSHICVENCHFLMIGSVDFTISGHFTGDWKELLVRGECRA
jgi:hypothetical protein